MRGSRFSFAVKKSDLLHRIVTKTCEARDFPPGPDGGSRRPTDIQPKLRVWLPDSSAPLFRAICRKAEIPV